MFHGQGGYDWNTVYNMPIWLRKYTFNKIKEYYDKQNQSRKNASTPNKNKKTLVDNIGNVNKQEFQQASRPYTKTSYK